MASGRQVKSPPPAFRPPPPSFAPPVVDNNANNSNSNNNNNRKSSACSSKAATPSPKPPPHGFKRLPTSRSTSVSSGAANGHEENSMDFLDLLEKEEADFAEQIKRQKSFLQSVVKEKEDLAQICHGMQVKLQKLEAERQEWQRKIIEVEREKRDIMANEGMNKTLADANIKLKLEIGNVRTDYDKLMKTNEGLTKDVQEMTLKATEASKKLREKDQETGETNVDEKPPEPPWLVTPYFGKCQYKKFLID